MAMLREGTTCALCGMVVEVLDLPGFIALPCVMLAESAFAPLDDAVVHRACLEGWRHRDDFLRVFNRALADLHGGPWMRLRVDHRGRVSWEDVSGVHDFAL